MRTTGVSAPRNKHPWVKVSCTESDHVNLAVLTFSGQAGGKGVGEDLSPLPGRNSRRDHHTSLPSISSTSQVWVRRMTSRSFSLKTCSCKNCMFLKLPYFKKIIKIVVWVWRQGLLKIQNYRVPWFLNNNTNQINSIVTKATLHVKCDSN